jgi:hypothetical protein
LAILTFSTNTQQMFNSMRSTNAANAKRFSQLNYCHLWSVPAYFATVKMRWNAKIALALVFLAAAFNASAGEQPMRGQVALGPKSFSGHVTSTVTTREQGLRSGIAGQVFLIIPILNLDEGLGDYDAEQIGIRLWVYVKIGDHFRHIRDIETAQDGSFLFDAPPATYMLEPDPTSGYSLGGVIGLYTDTLEITVVPRQISYDEIYVVSASPFPGLN